jgi:anti-sigma-K factor RskA
VTHEEMSGMYELYALGVLEAEEREEIESHLARECPECRSELRKAMALNTAFATLPDAADPPRRLRKRVLASVGVPQRGMRILMAALALVAAGLVVIVIADQERIHQSNDQKYMAMGQTQQVSQELTKLQGIMSMLNQPETKAVTFGVGQPLPPHGRVFVHQRMGVLLLASNLPQPPSGKTWELWVILKGDPAPKPAGLFQSDAQGNAMYMMTGPVNASTAAVAVTLEPEAGSLAPTTKPVIVASLGD